MVNNPTELKCGHMRPIRKIATQGRRATCAGTLTANQESAGRLGLTGLFSGLGRIDPYVIVRPSFFRSTLCVRVRHHFMRLCLALFVISGCLVAQTIPRFEVTSVKRSAPDQAGIGGGVSVDSALFRSSRVPLRNLIYSAYGVPSWRLSGGPDWLDTDAYDISATLPSGTSTDQIGLMLQGLLADRFHLRVHRETREASVYALVVAQGGSRLKPAAGNTFAVKKGPGHLEIHHATVPAFISYLNSGVAGRPVLDATELSGYFDFTLDWSSTLNTTEPQDLGPSLFTAIQEQLGLKLEPRKRPAEFIVIDRIDRPDEN